MGNGKITDTEGGFCAKNSPRRFWEVAKMAGSKKPMQLNLAAGGKHWTKAEIQKRLESEVQPVADGITAPSFLTAKQKKEFTRIAEQLQKLEVMGETDCDTLARYIVSQSLYEQAVKDLQAAQKDRPVGLGAQELAEWVNSLDVLDRRIERYYKQAMTAANALGLTISSRCKLVVPKAPEEPKKNKFRAFSVGDTG